MLYPELWLVRFLKIERKRRRRRFVSHFYIFTALKKESSSEGIEMLCSKVLVKCFELIQSHVREEYAQQLRGARGYQALDAILQCSTTPFYAETQLEGLHAAAMDSILGFYPSDASVRKDVSEALRTLCVCVLSVHTLSDRFVQ